MVEVAFVASRCIPLVGERPKVYVLQQDEVQGLQLEVKGTRVKEQVKGMVETDSVSAALGESQIFGKKLVGRKQEGR